MDDDSISAWFLYTLFILVIGALISSQCEREVTTGRYQWCAKVCETNGGLRGCDMGGVILDKMEAHCVNTAHFIYGRQVTKDEEEASDE